MHNIGRHGGDGSVADYEMRVTKEFGGDTPNGRYLKLCKYNTARGR